MLIEGDLDLGHHGSLGRAAVDDDRGYLGREAESSHPIAIQFREPEGAARGGRDLKGVAARGDAGGELDDLAYGVDGPTRLPLDSVNQRVSSGPAVIPFGPPPAVRPAENSVTWPAVVMRPILPPNSVNQRLPSGPAVIPAGWRFGVIPALNSVMTPAVVIRPTPPRSSVNQRLWSGPTVISNGSLFRVSPVRNSVTTPAGVIRAIAPNPLGPSGSVNQILPSGPVTIPEGWLPAVIPVETR